MDAGLLGGIVAAAALVHLVAAWMLATPPTEAVPGRAEYLQRWRAAHGGYDPSANVWVRGWLTVMHRVAHPLARRGVAPDAITTFALWPVAGALVCAAAGGRWALVGALLVTLSGVIDGLDGAVAVMTSRGSRWGYLLDSLVDRVADLGYVAALVLLGAWPLLGVAVGGAVLLHEYARARGSHAGAGEVGAVTVGERPTRVLACGIGLVVAGAVPQRASEAAGVALAILAALSAVGLVQLLIALRRALADDGDGAAG